LLHISYIPKINNTRIRQVFTISIEELKKMTENEIDNVFVKGNSHCKNAAIRKFKAGKDTDGNDNKVIMLSLKNAASGTNLTEATHIFFVEPINSTSEECKAIEGQAIARACRVGQKHQIVLMRILIENTIEETIYRKSYDKDIVVDFSEPTLTLAKKPDSPTNLDNEIIV
jgi:SNF2 family DNA or RNA helicase